MKERPVNPLTFTLRKTGWKPNSGWSRKSGWLTVAYNDGYSARILRELLEIVELNRNLIERTWNEFFS
jgi:hypothetical protein